MFEDFLKWAWRTIGVFRGAVVAIAVVSILHGLGLWEFPAFLRLTHAIVVHWNYILEVALSPIYRLIPQLPELSDRGANLLVLQLSLYPYFFSSVLRAFEKKRFFAAWYMIFLLVFGPALPWLADANNGLDDPLKALATLGLSALALTFMTFYAFRFKERHFERLYAKSIVGGLAALAVFEVLYLIPQVAAAAEGFVRQAERIEAAKADKNAP